jgi:hypothetical protein
MPLSAAARTPSAGTPTTAHHDPDREAAESRASSSEVPPLPGAPAGSFGTAESEPGTAESEPGTAASEPGTAESEPGTAESEPGTAESEPGTAESEPGTVESGREEDRVAGRATEDGDRPADRDGAEEETGAEEVDDAGPDAAGR